MLDELHIRNLGVIEEADVTLSSGLTVLTGETGAGKTMVVTALQLLTGGRGDATLVRTGCDGALVEARWVPAPTPVVDWLVDDEQSDEDDDGGDGDDRAADGGGDRAEVVVSRDIRASGRSRVRIAGRMATVGALGDTLGPVVEVHAQDSHRRLLEPATQRALLDAWAGADHLDDVAAHARAHRTHHDLVARREELAVSATQRVREVDQLEREVADIDGAELVDQDADLESRIDELTHADDLRNGLRTAAEAAGVDGAGEGLGIAVDALRRLPTTTPMIDGLRQRLDEVVALGTDVAADLRIAAESIAADPDALDRAQSRLATVRRLTRRFGPELDDVRAHRDWAAQRLAALETLDQDAASMDADIATAVDRMQATAAAVTRGRGNAARELASAVMPHLADLGLELASFEVAVDTAPMTSHGADTVTFLLAPNPGHDAVELGRAASGGERSRVALALEVALADVTAAEVLVFDEVDAGVGGATAMKVGEKLAMLAREGRQVLCVTHLAQLAAWADCHVVVDKVVVDGATRSIVTEVPADDRVVELARMLGGETTQAAQAHAAELMADAVA